MDSLSWSRPEDITTPRSFYYNKLALNGASDLNGQIVGALASTALVFKTSQPTLYDKYMNVALPLYGLAIGAHLCCLSFRPSGVSPLPSASSCICGLMACALAALSFATDHPF